MRHGKSNWKAGRDDFERPLATRGRRDAPRVGRRLLTQGFIPDAVISSPAARARETVDAVLEILGTGSGQVIFDDRIYGADLDDLLNVLGEFADARLVMIVGHNPGLESLLYYLAYEQRAEGGFETLLPTAARPVWNYQTTGRCSSEGQRNSSATLRPKNCVSPHFSPGGEMITQQFVFTRNFPKEWNNSVYFRLR